MGHSAKTMMLKKFLYTFYIMLVVFLGLFYFIYAGSVQVVQREITDNVWVTEFVEHSGGVNGHFEMVIVPDKASSLLFVKLFYDYIFLVENDEIQYSYNKNGVLSVYIPPNKGYVKHRGTKYKLGLSKYKEYTNFSGVKQLKVIYGN